MLTVTIPGWKILQLTHMVLDYNGTIALDGCLIDGVKPRLTALAASLTIHILTADTFGCVREAVAGLPCQLAVIPVDRQAEAKLAYVLELGPQACVCIGNGRNDRLMLKEAALGMALVQAEGAAPEAILAADVVSCSILEAFDLLCRSLRLTATLRS
ncbi:MAG: ATPase P [Syntrophobacteraceae bacterium]|nr:ATPase P [Syntrophobacteraceae bacterium]